jgi:uncharacterized protein (DUF2062 family)
MRIIIREARDDRTIDMNPDGSFSAPPATPIADRILRVAAITTALAMMLAVGLLALWAALIAIPVALAAAAVAYGAWRWRMWRGRA